MNQIQTSQRSYFLLVLFLLLFLIVACNGTKSTPEPVAEVNAQVFVFPSGTEKRLISDEKITQDNCVGSAETSQTITRQHTVQYTMELGSELKVNAEGKVGVPGVGEVGVGTEVATHYNVGYGRQETVSRAVTVAAAPKSHIQHTIQQFEVWEIGEVLIVVGDYNQRLPYSFRRDFSIDAVAPANLGCQGAPTTSPSENVTPESLPTATLQNNPTLSTETNSNFCPPLGSPNATFTEQLSTMGNPIGSAGTGIFANVVQPWGTEPTTYLYVKDALTESCVQLVSPGNLTDPENSRHCMTSKYNTNRIWVGTVKPGTMLVIRPASSEQYEIIGRIDKIAPDARSYLVEYDLEVGDEICLEAPAESTMGDIFDAGGYVLMIGRDLMLFTDSWCLMLENDNSQHWCQ